MNKKKGSLVITRISSILKGSQPELELHLEILLQSISKHKSAFLAVDILDAAGTGLMQAIPRLDGFLRDIEKEHLTNVLVKLPPLIPGKYLVTVWVGSHNTETLDEVKEVVMFEIHESPTIGRSYPHTTEHGYIVPASTVIMNVTNASTILNT